ncbi:MAG: hypothetical protein M4579_001432 [Chaenotheca gracillima]|nr:MAG: hypothetical protein M4579_001432 [Chaenotheca gracillima]
MATSTITLPYGFNDSRGNSMLEAVWIEAGIASIIMGLRMYTRIAIVKKVSLDDYLMMLSLILAVISGAMISKGVADGFGRHIISLAPEKAGQAIKYAYLAQTPNAMAQCFGRMSFAWFLVRVIGVTKTRRWILYSIMAGQFVINVMFISVNLGNCRPINKYWNPLIPGSCWSPLVIEYAGYLQGGEKQWLGPDQPIIANEA